MYNTLANILVYRHDQAFGAAPEGHRDSGHGSYVSLFYGYPDQILYNTTKR